MLGAEDPLIITENRKTAIIFLYKNQKCYIFKLVKLAFKSGFEEVCSTSIANISILCAPTSLMVKLLLSYSLYYCENRWL